MDPSVSPTDEIWFLRVCHHISTGLYFRSIHILSWRAEGQILHKETSHLSGHGHNETGRNKCRGSIKFQRVRRQHKCQICLKYDVNTRRKSLLRRMAFEIHGVNYFLLAALITAKLGTKRDAMHRLLLIRAKCR